MGRGGLHVWAEINEAEALTISGQDLRPPAPLGGEYEYVLTVARADTDTVVVALGGAPVDDVLPLLKANGPMMKGEGEPRRQGREAPFIRSRSLHGRGIGYVDAQPLASTVLGPGTVLWSTCKGLRAAATGLGVAHQGGPLPRGTPQGAGGR